jgi:hypothetical protein
MLNLSEILKTEVVCTLADRKICAEKLWKYVKFTVSVCCAFQPIDTMQCELLSSNLRIISHYEFTHF